MGPLHTHLIHTYSHPHPHQMPSTRSPTLIHNSPSTPPHPPLTFTPPMNTTILPNHIQTSARALRFSTAPRLRPFTPPHPHPPPMHTSLSRHTSSLPTSPVPSCPTDVLLGHLVPQPHGSCARRAVRDQVPLGRSLAVAGTPHILLFCDFRLAATLRHIPTGVSPLQARPYLFCYLYQSPLF